MELLHERWQKQEDEREKPFLQGQTWHAAADWYTVNPKRTAAVSLKCYGSIAYPKRGSCGNFPWVSVCSHAAEPRQREFFCKIMTNFCDQPMIVNCSAAHKLF